LLLDDAEFKTDRNDMIINGKRYRGREGVWELVTMKKPKTGACDGEDMKKYKEIMISSDVMRNSKDSDRPASNKGHKWEIFMRQIWNEHVKAPKQKAKRQQKKTKTAGQGVFLPSDPNALCERLELLMASKQEGNTGLRNEIVIICDELLRQKSLPRDAYKNLMPALNK